jgi:hypothetical protein
VSLDRKRWLLLAQDLKFHQLDVVRKQADTWRAGLVTLTTLLTGVLIVKGRSDASAVPTVYQAAVAALLAAALALLLASTLWLSRALAGTTKQQLLTGEGLEEWAAREARKAARAVAWAPGMAATSVILVAAAAGVTWFAPSAMQQPANPLVRITVSNGQSCGALVGETRQEVIITAPPGGAATAIPMPSVLAMAPVTSCA